MFEHSKKIKLSSEEEKIKNLKIFLDFLLSVQAIRQNHDENPHYYYKEITANLNLLFLTVDSYYSKKNIKKRALFNLINDFYNQYPECFSEETITHFDELTQVIGYRHGYVEDLRLAMEKIIREKGIPLSNKNKSEQLQENQIKNENISSYDINIVIDIQERGPNSDVPMSIKNKYPNKEFRYYTWTEFKNIQDETLQELSTLCKEKKVRFYISGHCRAGLHDLSEKIEGGKIATDDELAKKLSLVLDGRPEESVSILGCEAAKSSDANLENCFTYPFMNKLYGYIYERKKGESTQPPDIAVRVTGRTESLIPDKSSISRTLSPYQRYLKNELNKIDNNIFSKNLTSEEENKFETLIFNHQKTGSKLIFSRNKNGIKVTEAYTNKPYQSSIPPKLTSMEKFIQKLIFYKDSRETFKEMGYMHYYTIFGIPLSKSIDNKISGVKKLIHALETKSEEPIKELSNEEWEAIKEDLKNLFNKKKNLLPPLLQRRLDETIFTKISSVLDQNLSNLSLWVPRKWL